ncbi:hypothetical protein M2131_001255 [Polynucleobacter sphagniphilus]|uniref:AccI family restriction endonuclease n=1 Tax=Polynucleobacter sphagniphilus TaxID=1743169 RepID=UPI0024764859|nr:AccI family restriction endonuclease [Polynucleobacter sphagniphilus]MDH6421314.1 hypothetical protein [Polynucleobacter sphagniphilus]
MDAIQQISNSIDDVTTFLKGKGIEERYLQFGGEDLPPAKQPRAPTDARSEFLANRAMGDWAENVLTDQINQGNLFKAVHYGNTETIAAGEEGFKEYYLSALEEVRRFGKRPDLLVFPKGADIPADLSSVPVPESDKYVVSAQAAIEVRSSKFEAQTYMRVRQEEKLAGKSGNETPSFTVKVEDLRIVYRWIERHKISQSYCQVFFDSVYAINVTKIFEIIATGKNFKIETPEKSQLKTTIMIPITSGELVGRFETLPEFAVENKVTRLGRHDAYVKPVGGKLVLDQDKLKSVLVGS